MKFVMLTDTHLGIKNNKEFWLDLTEKLFDQVIEFCLREDIDTIVHLGDFFNDRKSLNVRTMLKGWEICKKISDNDIKIYIIKGNHDQYYKNISEPLSLFYLNPMENVEVVATEPLYLTEKEVLVPWGYDIGDIEVAVENGKYCTNLFGHFEINGFVTNHSGSIHDDVNSYQPSAFDLFNRVFSGHFHTKSKDRNITYIGSAFALNFNDIGDTRGYYLYEDGETEFYEFNFAPKFVRIDNIEDITEENIKGNIVEFIFKEDYGIVENDQIIQSINDLQPIELHIKSNIKLEVEEGSEEEIEDIGDNSEVIMDYIDKRKVPKNIKKDMLKKFVKKLEKTDE